MDSPSSQKSFPSAFVLSPRATIRPISFLRLQQKWKSVFNSRPPLYSLQALTTVKFSPETFFLVVSAFVPKIVNKHWLLVNNRSETTGSHRKIGRFYFGLRWQISLNISVYWRVEKRVDLHRKVEGLWNWKSVLNIRSPELLISPQFI